MTEMNQINQNVCGWLVSARSSWACKQYQLHKIGNYQNPETTKLTKEITNNYNSSFSENNDTSVFIFSMISNCGG